MEKKKFSTIITKIFTLVHVLLQACPVIEAADSVKTSPIIMNNFKYKKKLVKVKYEILIYMLIKQI